MKQRDVPPTVANRSSDENRDSELTALPHQTLDGVEPLARVGKKPLMQEQCEPRLALTVRLSSGQVFRLACIGVELHDKQIPHRC